MNLSSTDAFVAESLSGRSSERIVSKCTTSSESLSFAAAADDDDDDS